MSIRKVPEKFRVAFSFAGEQRDLVRTIAEAVEKALGHETVFFDEWFEDDIAGDDADVRLQDIYIRRSTLVIPCISQRYGEKPWTRAEHKAIRALQMELVGTEDQGTQFRVLPLRVGDGDVPGILFNTICPDIRTKSIDETIQLINGRLSLIGPARGDGAKIKAPIAHSTTRWKPPSMHFKHGLADRTVQEWPAVIRLLTAGAAKRILMFKGPSGHSKSALLGAANKYAKALRIPTVYVDFRDTRMLNEANVLRELQVGLGRVLPAFVGQKDPDRWRLREALQTLQEPALILLDAYEKAAATKELVEWIETQLLANAEESEDLRFIIGGQEIPDLSYGRWRDLAEAVELDRIHDQRLWKEWIHELNPNVDEKHIEAIVVGLDGIPSAISTVLVTFAQKHNRQS